MPRRLPRPLPTNGPPISATYEVTNDGAEAFTYTILFDFLTKTGEGGGSRYVTVRSVGPGATVRGTVQLGALDPRACPVTRVRVGEVTKVPAAEAPPEPGECPPSGLRLTLEGGTSATGLHIRGLRLENCGTRDYSLDGYPLLEPLDTDRSLVEGVQILHGSGGIILPGGEFDEPAHPLVLKPGESAFSSLLWRSAAGRVTYVRVRAQPGADPVTLTLHLDIGTTGKLAVRAWTRTPT